MFDISVTEDEKYLILDTSKDCARVGSPLLPLPGNIDLIASQKNLIWIADFGRVILGKPIQWKKLFDSFDAEYS